ncbi:hypothetical protein [Oceanobacillus profundus]|nr:hypothetical protein [Oceanobacillus profundus]MBR3119678.1 hypothetical protein [Oceanobacillus sp.]
MDFKQPNLIEIVEDEGKGITTILTEKGKEKENVENGSNKADSKKDE